MENLLTYIIQVNLLLSIIYLGYVGLLKGLTFYSLNRGYFLIGGLFAFIYPFLDLKSLFVQRGLDMGLVGEQISFYIEDPEVQEKLTLAGLVEMVFILGAVLLLLKFLFQLLSLLRIHFHSTADQWKTYFFRNVFIPIVPFSFLNKIYVNKGQHMDAELKDIFKHEDIHVKGLHSLDILLFEMILVCCWYNPFVWFMRRAIRQNLEFLTDQQVLNKGIDKQTYQYSLLNVSKKGTSIGLSNQFNFKLLKRRIMMMNRKRSSKIELSKYAFLLPVFLLTGAAFTVSKAEGSIEGVVEKANETTLLKLDDQQRDSTLSVKMVGEAGKLLKEAFGSNEIKIDTLHSVKANQASDFKKISRSDIDFSKDLKYFIDNKLVSKADFLAYPERKLSKYWFSNDNALIKYKTKLAIDISRGAILANSVEKQQKQDIAQTKMRYFVDGVLQNPGFNVNDFDPNSIASMTVLEGPAAVNKYGDAGKDGVIELKLKEGTNIGKKVTELRGKTIGIKFRNNKPSDAVYFIDGKKADQELLSDLKSDDIENITVLKGASAVEKYGQEAEYGVVLITTKSWARENPDKISKAAKGLKSENKVDETLPVLYYKKNDDRQEAKTITFEGKSKTDGSQSKSTTFDAKGMADGLNFAPVGGKNGIRIRGSSGTPLFVVDGQIHSIDINDLKASDIASVEVLKNQSATALYGAAGGNGVIIITTKKAAQLKETDDKAESLEGKINSVIKTELDVERKRAEAAKGKG
ncbi:TonB-dependent receptor plug domain-containing protein [Sphingobacterium sp. BIGb0165]|uniref:M56 family metallopeptidase n=1 Tax=Sphingobacterium sp. BIGb0165 TaxID=2940615 RepID=UPI00216828BD|nr:M56 family metallopeptidase [Sphingobacterium sp. BIGb0165]MCS4225242.1 TonB-dependent SusC/RagA subfamily outer membrane receptor [Sphingobacterium sp. BIGb0165]